MLAARNLMMSGLQPLLQERCGCAVCANKHLEILLQLAVTAGGNARLKVQLVPALQGLQWFQGNHICEGTAFCLCPSPVHAC